MDSNAENGVRYPMCQSGEDHKHHVHSHNHGARCCGTGLPVTDEIRLLEEQKSDLAAIIGRIDAKIEHLKRELP